MARRMQERIRGAEAVLSLAVSLIDTRGKTVGKLLVKRHRYYSVECCKE